MCELSDELGEAQPDDLRLAPRRLCFAPRRACVLDALLDRGEHLLGGAAGGADDEDEAEAIEVLAVRVREIREDLRLRVGGALLLVARPPAVAALADPRVRGERLVVIDLAERPPRAIAEPLQRGDILERSRGGHRIGPPCASRRP